jgi:DNA-binding NarL/FixJ family response regulator
MTTTATRILHIDPDPDYRLLVRTALDATPDLQVVADAPDLETGRAAVAEHAPDLVLVEPHVGGRADVEGLTALQAAASGAHTVVLTCLPTAELDWTGHLAGARGLLSKRVRPTALADELRSLRGVLGVLDGALAEAHTELDPDLVSPRRAREFVTETLERWSCSDATAIIDLLVSEIVANAVIHANTAAELTVQLLPDRVRVAVTDEEPTQPKRRPDNPLTSSGRGIALIERLSLAWGIDRRPGGKRIWFETPRPDGPDAR